MTNYIEVVPAYGRDYTSQKAVKADWNADKDFKIPGGPYLNKADAEREGVKVIVRYGRLLKVVAVN